ncbi:MAG: glycosyltransferase family 4 protein [Bacteroidota bacterium]
MKKSKKILFLTPYPHGKAPSQRFRFEQYIPLLLESGHTVELKSFIDHQTWNVLYARGKEFEKTIGIIWGYLKRLLVLFSVRKYDFVLIHREATPLGPPMVEFILSRVLKKKIIYDFDDAIWLSNTSSENKIIAGIKWHKKVRSICKWSYKVSCGNEFLSEFARNYNENVIINPTTIDTVNLHNPDLVKPDFKDDLPVIGWTGTHSTIKYLYKLVPILQELEREIDFKFLIISNKKPDIELNSLDYIPWNLATEIEDLARIDIGVMPLEDDLWSKGKCGFKALQYLALGIPAVVSPVGVNTKIIENNKNGFLCDSDEEWLASLKSMLVDEKHRTELGRYGRQTIIQQYSVISNKNNFLDLFE